MCFYPIKFQDRARTPCLSTRSLVCLTASVLPQNCQVQCRLRVHHLPSLPTQAGELPFREENHIHPRLHAIRHNTQLAAFTLIPPSPPQLLVKRYENSFFPSSQHLCFHSTCLVGEQNYQWPTNQQLLLVTARLSSP